MLCVKYLSIRISHQQKDNCSDLGFLVRNRKHDYSIEVLEEFLYHISKKKFCLHFAIKFKITNFNGFTHEFYISIKINKHEVLERI